MILGILRVYICICRFSFVGTSPQRIKDSLLQDADYSRQLLFILYESAFQRIADINGVELAKQTLLEFSFDEKSPC
ncbi:MAG: hypothetical protein EXR21_02850 [Flavobacteriaceae bacterium]|nr:hypothetical protein [Flavobacteriaceae bacterium]